MEVAMAQNLKDAEEDVEQDQEQEPHVHNEQPAVVINHDDEQPHHTGFS